MLVLHRRVGEELCIGDNIVVRVVRLHGNGCKLAIEAPENIPIARGELVQDDLAARVRKRQEERDK